MSAPQSLSGRVALVTGGTRGIGKGIAARLLEAGATVYVCGRSAPSQRETPIKFVAGDVRDAGEVAAIFQTIETEQGGLDILVNNAGGSPEIAAADASPRLHEKIIQLNLIAPLHCAQAAHRLMVGQDNCGVIINIASVSAIRSSPWTAAYGAAKAGLINLTESLAMEWGPKIRVNAIIAGLIATEAAEKHYGGDTGVERVGNMLPLKRMGTPEDIAEAALFLASDQAAYVSGAALAVHGGGEVPVFIHLARGTTGS